MHDRMAPLRAIRCIATTWDGVWAAVATFEQHVAVWDLFEGRKVAEFDTIMDAGGRRLAVTADGRYVIAGAFNNHGVAAYDASNGRLLWQRKGLREVQYLTVLHDDKRVFAGLESRAGQLLNIADGATVQKHRGCSKLWHSPFEDVVLLEKPDQPFEFRTTGGALLGQVQPTTFGLIDAAFAPGRAIVSEATGPIRCFRTSDAEEVFRFTHVVGTHAMCAGFDEHGGAFQAVTWSYQHDGDHTLLRFDPRDGTRLAAHPLPTAADFDFCLRGSHLLMADGSLIHTATGSITKQMDLSMSESFRPEIPVIRRSRKRKRRR